MRPYTPAHEAIHLPLLAIAQRNLAEWIWNRLAKLVVRILKVPPSSAASGRPSRSWKAPPARSLERLRYVAHAFQRAGSGGFPAARRWYFQAAPQSRRTVALTLPSCSALIASVDEPEKILEPLPYHIELRDYLKSEERELWNWFASAQAKADYTENLRLELLKSTYRLDAQPALPTPNRDPSSTCP